MLLSYYVKAMTRSARWLTMGVLVAALPFTVAASIVTVDFSTSIGASGNFTVNNSPSDLLTDSYGSSVTESSGGLESFNLSYGGNNYDLAEALDAAVFLPGNTYPPSASAGEYGFLAVWVVDGSVSGNFESLVGVGRGVGAFLLTNVLSSSVGFGYDSHDDPSSLTLGVCPTTPTVTCPNIRVTEGSITGQSVVSPEPTLLPLVGLGLAGLWFVRRRKAIQ